MIIIHILITVIFYFILMYISVNLIGFFVRGLIVNPDLDLLRLKEEGYGDEFIEKSLAMKYKKNEPAAKRSNIIMTTIALVLILIYFYLLSLFWNIGVTSIAGIFMLTRLPDLIWEIKNGKKLTPKNMPRNALYYITSLSTFAFLPVLYYFLYHF